MSDQGPIRASKSGFIRFAKAEGKSLERMAPWIYSFCYIGYFFLLPYFHVTYPENAFYILFIGYLIHFLDFVISDTPHKNLVLLHKNGYSNGLCLFNMGLNLMLIQSVWILINYVILSGVEINYYLNFWLVLKIILTLIIIDIYFYFAHKQLHETETGAKIHLMHHCSFYCSVSMGLIFHPLDFLIEFGSPNIVLILFYYLLGQDTSFLIYTGCIILGWYAAEHDERIRLHHYYHHVSCDGDYFVYAEHERRKDYDPNELIKKMIKE